MGIAYKLSCHRCGYESDLLYLGQGMAMLPEQIVGDLPPELDTTFS